jgi:hypothetical protein
MKAKEEKQESKSRVVRGKPLRRKIKQREGRGTRKRRNRNAKEEKSKSERG